MKRTISSLIFLLSFVLPGYGFTAAFEVKTMRQDMPPQEVDRSLVIGKGWLEFGFDYSIKITEGAFDDVGAYTSWDNAATFTYHTALLEINYGITKNSELYLHLPYIVANVSNDYGTSTTSYSFGDLYAGWLFQVLRSRPAYPVVSVVTRVFLKGPSGEESPGTYYNSPLNFTRFVTSTGCFNLGGGIEGKVQLPFRSIALLMKGGYITKFSSTVMFLSNAEMSWSNGRIDPGDEVYLGVGMLFQLARGVAFKIDIDGSYHMETRIGMTSGRPIPSLNLEPVEGSDGLFAFAYPGFLFNMKEYFDIYLFGGLPLTGRNSDLYWPIEELSPSAGYTAGINLFFRY